MYAATTTTLFSSVACPMMSMICRRRMRSLAFLQAEWIPMLTGHASIALSQMVQGRPQGLLRWLGGETTTLHPFNSLFTKTNWVCWYQKGKTSLDFNEARDDRVLGWQWHHLDHMQTICTSLQTDNHTNQSSLNVLQVGCSSWCATNSVKELKDSDVHVYMHGNLNLTNTKPNLR